MSEAGLLAMAQQLTREIGRLIAERDSALAEVERLREALDRLRACEECGCANQPHDLSCSQFQCSAPAAEGECIEPGQPIGATGCPCCGARLRIEYGDDPGEIAALYTDRPTPRTVTDSGLRAAVKRVLGYVKVIRNSDLPRGESIQNILEELEAALATAPAPETGLRAAVERLLLAWESRQLDARIGNPTDYERGCLNARRGCINDLRAALAASPEGEGSGS